MEQTTSSENKPKKTFGEVIKESFKELKETFIAFINAPKALWGINLPYIIEGLVYFGILTILGKFASENVALEDTEAGLIYSLVTGGITFAMLLLGGYSDKIGVRNSLIVAFAAMIFGRVVVALSGTLGLSGGLWSPMFYMMCIGLLIMVTGYGLYQPAAYAGVKRYTNEKTAAMGYAVIYGFMNLGAFISGFISSFTRQSFEQSFPPNGLTAVFWIYVVLTVICLLLTVFLITRKNDKEAVEASETDEERKTREEEEASGKKDLLPKADNVTLKILSGSIFLLVVILMLVNNDIFAISEFARSFVQKVLYILIGIAVVYSITDYMKRRPQHPFRDVRFTFFIFILIPVQTLFAHNWLTIPYYLDRAFQGSIVSEYFEIFSNINPVLIFILAPIVAGLTAKANVYKMMILGTIVMSVPTFLLTIGPNMYLFLVYVLIMTIGEAMWQPRFLQWIAEIAPKNQTGLYMGVGQFPWFLTKVVTGFYSGWFVEKYIPLDADPSAMNSEFMWFVYGLIAIISPIGLILARKWMLKGFKVKAG